MAEPSDREKLDQQRMERARGILLELPRSCYDFIRAIATTTSSLTRLGYTIDLKTFFLYATQELPVLGGKKPSEVTETELALLKPRDIENYADYLSLYYQQNADEPSEQRVLQNHEYGIMRKLSSLRSYFDYLFRTSRIGGNIATLVPLPKLHDKPILRLETDEVERLLSEVSSGEKMTERQRKYNEQTRVRDYAILMLFLGTGIRVSELVAVNLEDVDFTSNAFLVTRKGGDQVILYFPEEVADALKVYLEKRREITAVEGHEHAFFLSLQRRRMTQRAVELMVKKYARLTVPLKKRMSPHKLRSTYATRLYQETEDIYLVAEALGHADVNTTRKHYAAMSDERRRQAAANTHLPVQTPLDENGEKKSE
ncbi:MAG: tyrosine-type recombinase/integrase [Eubacteriales bacterium]|nr:tyrosine-type recombinase/integrase [Eubacteriales bacterium]